ncbi:MAG: DUF308 domain-containing protein [Firmicutes bacterium]|nr:DUF308 domain-containing protein [Bacillota bacterium]
MKSLKANMHGILMSAFEVLVGVLLIIDPEGFTSGIIVAVGIALLLGGMWQVIQYFKQEPEVAAKGQAFLVGMVMLLGGGFFALKSGWLIKVFPLLTILYGVGVLVSGLMKVQWTVDKLRMKKKYWYLMAISAVVSLVCSALILWNPFASTAVLWKFTAIALILEAVFDLIAIIAGGKSVGEEE